MGATRLHVARMAIRLLLFVCFFFLINFYFLLPNHLILICLSFKQYNNNNKGGYALGETPEKARQAWASVALAISRFEPGLCVFFVNLFYFMYNLNLNLLRKKKQNPFKTNTNRFEQKYWNSLFTKSGIVLN